MRKLFLISATAVAAYVMTTLPTQALKDMPITSGTVLDNCAGKLRSALGAYGCTICNDAGSRCTDYSCNANPFNGARTGC